MIRLQIERQRVSQALSAILQQYDIEDISVSERPLEDVIAELFAAEDESAT